ncbi:alpha/beta hydrolase [Crocosphaera sp. XPORK-15E]|uniref:alpha/beta hydrolase n=1 Tax=Crocosphaera sp. XPORK-15E TaxID=3110247 RepID=UPI002B1EEF61|nr:alpha/beta hydrolase [Crocosphaera sp. XPORK-15E]MEA5536813.1 alpha/beta hydrolase [Crocosphaera sp. XPORK-15E]
MIIVISNRLINDNRNDENFLGEILNPQGADKITIAKAFYQENQKSWLIEPVSKNDNLTAENPSIKQLFLEIIKGIENNTFSRKWVFYIPGFNQSSRHALDSSRRLSVQYDVNVILFSWPSNPQGNSNSLKDFFEAESEYREALSIAKSSAITLAKVFTTLSQWIEDSSLDNLSRQRIKFTLLSHSLGNYVVENTTLNLVSSKVADFFDSIILHQADVDNPKHEQWINKIKLSKNIYITVNRHDFILTISGAFHKFRLNNLNVNNRLGNNTKDFTAQKAIYIDFTKGGQVQKAHDLLFDVSNPIVINFIKQIFKGNSPFISNRPFKQSDTQPNVYRLDQDFKSLEE